MITCQINWTECSDRFPAKVVKKQRSYRLESGECVKYSSMKIKSVKNNGKAFLEKSTK